MELLVLLELLVVEGYQVFLEYLVIRGPRVKKGFLVTVVRMVLLVHLVVEVTVDCKDSQAPLEAEKVVLNLMGLTLVL